MSISQTIAPHLPYLRRYARGLCGSQKAGDAYVCATLESLIADPSSFSSELEPKVALYRQLAKLWNSVDFNTADGPQLTTEADASIGRSLQAITPRPRQAFLLTSVERFTPEQAAAVLDTSPRDISELIDQAGREIAEEVATDVLIIEDEPIIAMDLVSIAESLGHRIIGRARTQKEAVRAVAQLKPGLILADIQLADGSSGLDAVNEILTTMQMPVVFITAYPERLLTGERPEPTFLITKPFDADMVKAIVSQALFFDARFRSTGEQVATA